MAMHHGNAALSFGTSPSDSFFAAAMDEARGRRERRLSTEAGASRIEHIAEADEESEAIDDEDDERLSRSKASQASASPRFGPRMMSPVPGASYGAIAARDRRTSFLSSSQTLSPMLALQTPIESTPLLKDTTAEEEAAMPTSAKGEAGVLISYALPILGTHVLEYSIGASIHFCHLTPSVVCTVVSLGHLGATELAAAALGSLSINVIALSVCQGFCTALDTLCSQAFKSRPQQAGLHALRTAFILTLLLVPQFLVCFFSERILLALGEEAEVSRLASLYLRAFAFALPGYNLLEVSRRWLQGQGILAVPTICLACGALLNVFLQWLFVWGPPSTNLGFVGAPIATAISFTAMATILLFYCAFYAPRTCWPGWPSAAQFFERRGLRHNLAFGIAGVALVGSEWLAWECIGFAVSYLGPRPLAAQSVLITTCSLTYQLPMAIGSGAAVRIGNLLGAGLPRQAQLSARITAVGAIVFGALNSSLLFFFRHVRRGSRAIDARSRGAASSRANRTFSHSSPAFYLSSRCSRSQVRRRS